MHIFIPMKKLPTATDQEKAFNRKTGSVYLKPQAKMDRQKLKDLLAQHVPDQPLVNVPITITVIWCFPITGSHRSGEPKITRPDTQNMCKGLYDVMTELGFWDDDSRIADEHLSKCYSNIPGLYIEYEEMKMKENRNAERNNQSGSYGAYGERETCIHAARN